MPITHFKITQLADARIVDSKLGTSPLIENAIYPISEQSNLKFYRVIPLASHIVRGSFKYQMIDSINNVTGNEATVSLFWDDQTGLDPASADTHHILDNGDVSTFLSLLALNNSVDQILITYLNRHIIAPPEQVLEGDIISVQDLHLINIQIPMYGSGHPYLEIKYKVLKDGIIFPIEYTASIDVGVEGGIFTEPDPVERIIGEEEFEINGVPTLLDTKTILYQVTIDKAPSNELADIQIVLNLDFMNQNQFNVIQIMGSDIDQEYVLNNQIASSFKVTVNDNGFATLFISVLLVDYTTYTSNGTIDITLNTFDGTTDWVDVNNNHITLTITNE